MVAVNWVGLILMGAALGPLQLYLSACGAYNTLLAINVVYGLLLANGLAYIFIPAVRGTHIMMKNHAINRRNLQRRAHAEALLKPTSHLAQKVEAAKRLAYQTKAISNHDVYYTTAKTLLEQSDSHDPQRDAWDAALKRKQS